MSLCAQAHISAERLRVGLARLVGRPYQPLRIDLDASVRTWTDDIPAALFLLSAIALLELELGILRLERCDATQGTLLQRWLEDPLLARFRERTLPST